MKIAKTEVIEENGIKYQKDTYDNGAIITQPWQDPDAPIPEPEPMPEPEPTIDENDTILTAISELYEQNLSLQESLDSTMLAIADLYENTPAVDK